MERRKNRVVAKVFLAVTVLFLFFTAVAYLLWLLSAKIALPFAMRMDYVLAMLGASLILFVSTCWLFALTRPRKEKEVCLETLDRELSDEVLAECATEPYTPRQRAVLKALAVRRRQAELKEAKRKDAARILVSVVGGFALGVAVTSMLKNHKRK